MLLWGERVVNDDITDAIVLSGKLMADDGC